MKDLALPSETRTESLLTRLLQKLVEHDPVSWAADAEYTLGLRSEPSLTCGPVSVQGQPLLAGHGSVTERRRRAGKF